MRVCICVRVRSCACFVQLRMCNRAKCTFAEYVTVCHSKSSVSNKYGRGLMRCVINHRNSPSKCQMRFRRVPSKCAII